MEGWREKEKEGEREGGRNEHENEASYVFFVCFMCLEIRYQLIRNPSNLTPNLLLSGL